MRPSVTIVIVNWNAGELLAACLRSIVQHHSGVVRAVIVVDNNSTDDSLQILSDLETDGIEIRVLRNEANRGFAIACNQGGVISESEYLLFLNPDTMLYAGSLEIPMEFLEKKENELVAAVGIQLIDEAGCVTRSCARSPTLTRFFAEATGLARLPWTKGTGVRMEDWPHDTTRAVDHLIGAFFMVRRSVFSRLGGFDERFFVYLEDVDLSLRIRELGYKLIYLVSAQAFHKGGGTSTRVKAQRLCYALRSKIVYGYKHFGRMRRWGLVAVTLVVEPAARCIYAGARGDMTGLWNTLKGYGMLYRNLLQAWPRREH